MSIPKPLKKAINPFYAIFFRKFPPALKRFSLRKLGAKVPSSCIIHKNALVEGKLKNLMIGNNVVIRESTIIRVFGEMIIEDNVYIRENCGIGPGHVLDNHRKVRIGKNTRINSGVYIETTGGIDIGEDVTITGGTAIFTHEHNMKKDKPILQQGITPVFDTIIGNDVFIGHGSVILGGLKIGDGAVTGAKSVVTKDVEPYTIVAGNPAKVIGERK